MAIPAIHPDRATITGDQYLEAYKAYHWFAQKVAARLNDKHKHLLFEVNPLIALNVSVATYDDIDRYKSYHLRNATPNSEARSDSVKRAAYFAKWTTKFHPVTYRILDPSFDDPDDISLIANEVLAASYAIELIGSELGKSLKYRDRTFYHLLYDLHYRDMTDDALLSLFQVIRDLAKSGKDNPIVEMGVA